MGDYKVIAGVSSTLQTLLEDRMETVGQQNGPAVTLLPPDESPDEGQTERVNLFLYRVGEHEQLKNQPLPESGGQASKAPLSLTLHYLLTAHADKSPLKAQRWLADAMRVFHDYSIITESLSRTSSSTTNGSVLDQTLQGEAEQIKVSLDPLSVEQMTEVWTSFTVPYRLSAAYAVSVVQIDSREPGGTVRLVGPPPDAGPKTHAVPFQTPRIREIRVERQEEAPPKTEWPYPYARIGDTLIIRGQNLAGEGETRVRIGDEERVVADDNLQETRLEVPLPDAGWLQPGPQPVSVRRRVAERPSSADDFRYTSNQCFFALVPRVDALQPSTLPASGGTLSITGSRLSQTDKETVVFVGSEQFDEGDFSTQTQTKIELDLSAPDPGDHPVRVRVAGMESILDDVVLTVQP